MAYTDVPEDLTRVKNKVLFNLTKRQIICVSIAALTGIPFYFLTRDFLGITNAATGMIILTNQSISPWVSNYKHL